MITLSNLERRRDARHKIKRLGRGSGSGHGGHTSTRGHKGQKARTGGSIHPAFEGGQMPLHRRLPKRGFNPIRKEKIQIVNLDRFIDFSKGTVVDPELLKKERLISSVKKKVKVLGNGKLKHSLTIKAHAFSEEARKKIEDVGGKIEVIGVRN
ncbi:MAG: 50S ribosomal protein L15 [Deltaproteobacteria bacterium GWA2_38_16]|nr:MAG: 50S ribosomal protein L15 [Deltaproteobacteria bacterium GWA2_38_16]OGQ03800.1 MAG: 50S ribosomal protein L15 [Deltaproteobacteria bacterium RIFCSPHIGHO2_02_FULL_38_15]OGQ34306.1 MAG: 50S ribosomal protein L15 [Deltaproteobacteria bacterium RIFCSPLOWO2_01_FULL_38_9]OGQ59149.1 MAG: 50S ribosomal protein L15 [Deltaproteobacteria bacterium RIFCSPLOWO2_12_FULL_38_8]HBQ20841.1 50S ribosomal protein L15 [Deltaproteobacteria bacterium]